MRAHLKENNFSVEASESSTKTIETKLHRPNIDHLIKRIIVEKRKEKKKNILLTFNQFKFYLAH